MPAPATTTAAREAGLAPGAQPAAPIAGDALAAAAVAPAVQASTLAAAVGTPAPAEPRAAASVVLLRDGAQGLEVFLVRRHDRSDVLGGAYVFPGGKVDDGDAALAANLDLPAGDLALRLGEPELSPAQAAALHAAALRELFEEARVLMAGLPATEVAAAWQALREGAGLAQLLRERGIGLHATAVRPWSRWVTPVGSFMLPRKRFDTRFFLARVPVGQQARHDEHEAVESLWVRPADALLRYWEGTLQLAAPQILSLSHLVRHASAEAALAQAAECLPACVRPEPFEEDGCRGICYPGDPRHSQSTPALPTVTRLWWRNGRYEPDGGVQALLG